MTLQTFSRALLAPARESRSPSFWHRLLDAIMEGRQRKADPHVADYLVRHSGDYHDQLQAYADGQPLPLERAGEAPSRPGDGTIRARQARCPQCRQARNRARRLSALRS